MTDKELLKRIEADNKWYQNGYITEICSPYVSSTSKIIVNTIYGKCLISPCKLYGRGCKPNIQSAIDQDTFLWNMVSDKNKWVSKGLILGLGKYTLFNNIIEVYTKYGICMMTASSVCGGTKPTIESCQHPTRYFINQCKEKFGTNGFTYDKVKYNGSLNDVTITCSIHGDFTKTPQAILRKGQYQGCPICSRVIYNKAWLRHASRKSKQFPEHKFTLYLVKCYNDNESFIKIGLTSRPIDVRLKGIPYKCVVIDSIISTDYTMLWNLESNIKKWIHKHSMYAPLKDFGGHYECSNIKSIINILSIMHSV